MNITNEEAFKGETYLTHIFIPVKGLASFVLPEEVPNILEEFNRLDTVKVILLDNTNTNTGYEKGLLLLKMWCYYLC